MSFEILFDCGIIGLLFELLRRVIRLETKIGLCKHCPVTTDDESTVKPMKKPKRNVRGGEITNV